MIELIRPAGGSEVPVADQLVRKSEFTLDQLDRMRSLKESQLEKRPLRTECYVDTQLMQAHLAIRRHTAISIWGISTPAIPIRTFYIKD